MNPLALEEEQRKFMLGKVNSNLRAKGIDNRFMWDVGLIAHRKDGLFVCVWLAPDKEYWRVALYDDPHFTSGNPYAQWLVYEGESVGDDLVDAVTALYYRDRPSA